MRTASGDAGVAELHERNGTLEESLRETLIKTIQS